MSSHLMFQDVLHIRVFHKQAGTEVAGFVTEEQDKVFDNLIAWCDAEQLFIGGTLSNAVVHASLWPLSTQQYRRLRRLILSHPGITGCQMQLRAVSSLHDLAEKTACLEALSHAQLFLAERMAADADAIAVLVPVSPRSWRASVTEEGARLELQHGSSQIWLAIARQDGKPVPGFAKFDKRIVALGDAGIFIPDWLDLRWSKVALHPEADLSVGRWEAESDGWRIWITGHASAQLTHREVMLRWMGMVSRA